MAAARPDHMSAYLYPRPTTAWPTTPQQRADGQDLSIDDMAVQGVLFAEAFAPSSDARLAAASLFTGRSPLALGGGRLPLESVALPPDEPTLAEAFRRAGFHTAAFVAGHELAGLPGLERGFDEFVTELDDGGVVSRGITWSRQDFGDGRQRFLWLHLDGPNAPYGAEPMGIDWPDGTPGPLDWVAAFADPGYAGSADGSLEWLERVSAESETLGPDDLQHVIDLYDAGLAESATMLRRYLVYLEQATAPAGLFGETVIAFCGLTGEELFEYGDYGHGERLSEEALRVPLFLRHPPSMTGSRILNTLVETTDLYPTLTEWFDVDVDTVDERSLLALTDSHVERSFAERPALAVLEDGSISARVPGWRAVLGRRGFELFAVELGRVESVDANAHAARAEELRSELAQVLSSVELAPEAPRSVRAAVE